MKVKRAKRGIRHSDHDQLFKGTFNIREIALAHLQNFLDPKLIKYFDWESLRLSPDSFVDDELNEQFSDVVYNVSLQNQIPLKISFLFEHKSALPGISIYIQLLKYLLRLWEMDIAQERKLGFVVPILVYHGKAKWKAKPFAAAFKGLPKEFERFLPQFDYNLTNVGSLPEEMLISNVELGALRSVFLELKYAFDEHKLKQNFQNIIIFAEGFQNPELTQMFIGRLFEYFQRRTSMEESEILQLLNALPDQKKDIMKSTYDNIIEKGRELGREEGREEKDRQFTMSLILNTDFSDEKIAAIVNVSVKFVEALRSEIALSAQRKVQ